MVSFLAEGEQANRRTIVTVSRTARAQALRAAVNEAVKGRSAGAVRS